VKEYYLLLQIDDTKTLEDITSSFRKLAKLYHPDINHSPEATDKLRRIIEAYDWMKKNHIQRKPKEKSKPKSHDNMFHWTFQNESRQHKRDTYNSKPYTDVFRWLTYPHLTHTIRISQNIINANDVKVHCMYNLDEFSFFVPMGTKLPTLATLHTALGDMKVTIEHDATIRWHG
jgi:DnaJ-class molecular chaperone